MKPIMLFVAVLSVLVAVAFTAEAAQLPMRVHNAVHVFSAPPHVNVVIPLGSGPFVSSHLRPVVEHSADVSPAPPEGNCAIGGNCTTIGHTKLPVHGPDPVP